MDILMSEFLPRKVLEHITSSLYSSVFLWTSKLPLFSMKKIPKQHLVSKYKCDLLPVGLKTLVIHHHHSEPPRVVHCYTIPALPTSKPSSARPLLPPPPPSMWLSSSDAFKCTMMGDVLGAESGDCMMMMTSEVVDQVEQVMIVKAEPPEEPSMVQSKSMMMSNREKGMMKREFPPPITLLRTHMGRMPWAFKRECGDDKRLIIRAERVTRHEHVAACRVNGTLTMNLVPEEDDDGEGDDDDDIEYCDECGYPVTEEVVEEEAVEFEDLEFNEEPDERLECEDEEQQEEEGGFEFEVEVDGSGLEKEEGKLCWDLRECVAYGGEGGRLVQDSGSLWATANMLGDPNGNMGRPASASAPLRPITSVV